MPVLRQPLGCRGPRLPPRERLPALTAAFDEDAALAVLATGEVEVLGRLTDASNATLLVTVSQDGVDHLAVYKPVAGERPLWDFPARTLASREVASYLVSRAAGWDVVPPTLLREDAPFGPGSLQWWLDAGDDAEGDPVPPPPGADLVDLFAEGSAPSSWLTVLEAEDQWGRPVVLAHADDPGLRRIALFDIVANNADRKGGHVLAGQFQAPGQARSTPGPEGRSLRGVDHGLTFHDEPKLRTVLWGWAGRRLTAADRVHLDALAAALDDDGEGAPAASLTELLAARELKALRGRLERLRNGGRFPRPSPGMPPIPWPAF